jgi:secretion/DNA translocation related CpaE-like protein
VGASVTAAGLALRAAADPTLLVDLDPWGPGLGRVVGGSATEGITWVDLAGVDGRLAASELRSALPRHDEVSLLSWPDERAVAVDDRLVAEVVAAGARGHDWVVLDVPRGGAQSPDLLGLCDLVVLLVESTVAGVAAAARVLAPLRAAGAPVGVLVRAGGGGASGADVARLLETPLLGEVGHDRRLREQVDAGLGPVRGRRSPVARAADAVLELLRPADDGRERW